MPYQIKKYDGTELTTIPDYQYNDTAATVVLFGKGVTNYGQPMAENIIHLLENFAGPTPPGLPARLGEPMVGQLWYDTANRKLRVRSPTTNWDIVGSTNVGTTPPNPPNAGDLWLDTSTIPAKLKIWNGTNWQLVGSSAAASSVSSSAPSGNATSSSNNYFTSTSLGDNSAPQMGDLWYDPGVGRLKVYNGSFWQFVGSPAAGIVDSTIANNTSLIPTSSSTVVSGASTATYHTSSGLGPGESQGIVVIGDLFWDNTRQQVYAHVGSGNYRLVGPATMYINPLDATSPTATRGFTDEVHYSKGANDFRIDFAGGQVMGVVSANSTTAFDLPSSYQYVLGPSQTTINVRTLFDNDSMGTDKPLTSGYNMSSNMLFHGTQLGIGEIQTDSQLTISVEDPATQMTSLRLMRYDADVAQGSKLVIDRVRGTRSAPTQVQNGDALGSITFRGYHSNQYVAGVDLTAYSAGNTLSGGNLPSQLILSTTGVERIRFLDTAVRGNVRYENIAGTGTAALATPTTEFPAYSFTGNTGTGMSSPTGYELNLALRGQLVAQMVVPGSGDSRLIGNWNTTGNHKVDGYLKVIGDIYGDEGHFRDITTDTITVNNETVDMSYFIRRDAGVNGAASRMPTQSANVDGTNGLDFGDATNRWGIYYGVASRANYADLAERYHADKLLDVGTVVKLGGENEITATTTSYDTDVFGVISRLPAYAMNDMAGTDETHPFVALTGRIPVKVMGRVKKGQRLVTSDFEGVAMAMETLDPSKIFAVLGRALEDKDTDGVELIEVVVGKN